jgi:hypothetical protein
METGTHPHSRVHPNETISVEKTPGRMVEMSPLFQGRPGTTIGALGARGIVQWVEGGITFF